MAAEADECSNGTNDEKTLWDWKQTTMALYFVLAWKRDGLHSGIYCTGGNVGPLISMVTFQILS